MGEVVVSSEGAAASMMAVAVAEEEERKSEREVVKWERFLPRMSLRVLLVEADDSTRQIITALLRKCSYKVAAVPDGLKAWEVLKARPHNIDLILTEVELPSVSGYALLTLIMEHDICKNIPVIMMSTHDPVSTVYNCMLRGAADFLVKPIRINELRNLWQHVWRRQSMNRGSEPRDESVAQQAVEATAENNAASDHLSGSKACLPRQEGIKKGSDAQSSCGKPEMEAESAYKEEADNCSVPSLRKSLACDANTQSLFSHEPGAADGRMEVHTYEKVANSAPEAIDLIGAFGEHSRHDHGFSSSNHVANVFESSPQLDLSLRRFYHYGLEDKSIHERHNLNHSNASAFTRYVNKARKEETTNFVGHLSDGIHKPDLSAKGALPSYNRKVISLPVLDQTEQSERESEPTPERLFPIPLPVREISLDAVCTGYRSPIPPILSRPLPLQALSSDAFPLCESNLNRMNSGRFCNTIDQSPRLSSSHATNKHEMRFDFVEDRAHISSAMDQSASSCGVGGVPISNGNVEENQAICDGNRQRSIQREAALSKFRMKRKERCYEKKVRYESRKKLAEQRPRVKGQFVRQVPPDPPPLICNNSYGNSVMSR